MSATVASPNCGCGAGPGPATPRPVENRPGLPALAWRVGTHGWFKAALVAGLTRDPALRTLGTRDDGDPTLALLDAWAMTLDVLTFYQERLANEHYLRTAKERRSILELARAIGYELAPGVSASTRLTFHLQTAATAPRAVTIPAGTKVQSIPGQDEKPQLFEVGAALEARGAWNALAVGRHGPVTPVPSQSVLHLAGVSSGLQPGDALLVVGAERLTMADDPVHWDFRRVRTVEAVTDPLDPAASRTRVELDRPLGSDPAQQDVKVYGLRRRAGLFGGTAPDWQLLPKATREEISGKGDLSQQPQWPRFNLAYAATKPAGLDTLYLDNVHPAAVKDAWLVLVTAPGTEQLFRIVAAEESGRAEFGVAGKSTRVQLAGLTSSLTGTFWAKLREAAVFLQTEEFTLVPPPDEAPLSAGATEIDLETELRGDDALPAGRTVILSGTDPADGTAVAETLVVRETKTVGGGAEACRTRLVLESALTHSYARSTAVVLANVVEATHGETRSRQLPGGLEFTEILGSGDGAVPFQKFVLKQVPLTHVPAATPSGRASSLEIRVDGVRWREVASFHGVGPGERVYTVRHGDDGKATLQFGDGRTGARLPTGVENVIAKYRVGTGLEGQVEAGQLTLLMSRPPGVREVSNPQAATGAEDPETTDRARENAPLTVRTLDRIVSLLDFEDFARAYAGIGKAAAVPLWTGQRQVVHLTVALADGTSPADDQATLGCLRKAIDAARHRQTRVTVQGYVARTFRVAAKIAVDADFGPETVLAEVTRALLDTFAFERRAFVQDVTAAEVIAAMQAVKGVVYVDLGTLEGTDGQGLVDGHLVARPARVAGAGLVAADLFTLAETDISLTPMTP